MYGAANILFTVRRGVKDGKVGSDVIGKTSLSFASLHSEICNISESSGDTEYHGIQNKTLSLRAKGHRGLGSGDLGSLEVSTVLKYRQVNIGDMVEPEEDSQTTKVDRTGYDNFWRRRCSACGSKISYSTKEKWYKLLSFSVHSVMARQVLLGVSNAYRP